MDRPVGSRVLTSRRAFLRRSAMLGLSVGVAPLAGCAAPTASPTPGAAAPPVPAAQPTAGTAQAPAAKGPLETVGFRMSWILTGYYAPFQAAIDKGYFAEQGLDVQILEGTGSGVALQLVANGQQPLGLIDAAVLASGVQKGIDARMVACMFQRSMWGILSPADKPLKQPADLIGKTIAVTPGGVAAVLFPAFARKAGIDVSQVTLASLDPPSQPAALLSRRVDGAVHQVPTDALIYEGQNFPVASLLYSDFGLETLGLGVVAMNQTIAERPDLIRGFLTALAKAWPYAIANSSETVALAQNAIATNLSQQALETQWKNVQDFQSTPRTKDKPLFWMDKQDWESTQAALREVDWLSEERPVETYYTNSFLPAG